MHSSHSTTGSAAEHWDSVYLSSTVHSWTEQYPADSMRMLESAGVCATDSVIDIGGGDSRLAATLLTAGYRDVSVLDVSSRVIATEQGQVTNGSGVIEWITADVRCWVPRRARDVWHDRAVFHFLTEPADQRRYIQVLESGIRPGGAVVIGTFAPEGPTHCSGLPVARYSAKSLLAALGPGFDPIHTDCMLHTTPNGVTQSFTWVAAQRKHRQQLPAE